MVKIWKLGLVNYDTALKIQCAIARKHLDAMRKGINTDYDTVLLVEHKPVFTVGIRDETPNEDILRLRSLGAEFKKTNRGGLITFHNPGQLVAYPVINLKHFKTSVKWYVHSLEETVIKLCEELGLQAKRSPYTGVWIENDKIAAIGIHASRYVTTHGISLNCDNDLSCFDHIDPCGIADKGVTSLTKETGIICSIDKITPMFIRHFEQVFECTSQEVDKDLQQQILNTVYNNIILDTE